jgi:hypothetical protein
MPRDLDVPTPPDLTTRGTPPQFEDEDAPASELDLRREELEALLAEGAWRDGFDEWAQDTDLRGLDVMTADDLGLFRSMDFYWDDDAEGLRYVPPPVPEDWDERAGKGAVSASTLQGELDDLGRTVAETVAMDYTDWGAADPEEVVWKVEDGEAALEDE